MNLFKELKNKLSNGEPFELSTNDGKQIEVWAGRWSFSLAVNGVVVKNSKTFAPIASKLASLI